MVKIIQCKTKENKNNPKVDGAYVTTTRDDRKWLLNHCEAICENDDYLKGSNLKEDREISERLNAPNPRMPKKTGGQYGWGRNSVRSMCEGVIDNFNKGQFDISKKQIPGLEESFRIIHEIYDQIPEIEFEEVALLPKTQPFIMINQKPIGNSTFPVLFDTDKIK